MILVCSYGITSHILESHPLHKVDKLASRSLKVEFSRCGVTLPFNTLWLISAQGGFDKPRITHYIRLCSCISPTGRFSTPNSI